MISEHNILSALSANSNISIKQYNKTLIALKKAGVIDDFLRKISLYLNVFFSENDLIAIKNNMASTPPNAPHK